MSTLTQVRNVCGACGAAAAGAWLCSDCRTQLTQLYATVPRIVADLRITLTRQDRHARIAARGCAPAAVTPWSEPAAAVLNELTRLLFRWDLDVGITRSIGMTAASLADERRRRLRRALSDARCPELDRALREILEAADRVIDIPTDGTLWPWGACMARGCPERLWAPAAAQAVACPRCRTLHTDMAERRAWLAETAADRLVSASLAGAWLAARHGGDETRIAARIRKWAERGRVTAHAVDPDEADDVDGRTASLYRLGDVEALLVDDLARRRRKATLDAQAAARRTPA